MLSIWPEIQPMSRVADFACCAILDFRSPSGNDYDNQEMPSGMSAALVAASGLTATAARSLSELELSGLLGTAADNRGNYRPGYLGHTDNRHRAIYGTGRAAGIGSGTNPPQQGKGFGHTGKRNSGNR